MFIANAIVAYVEKNVKNEDGPSPALAEAQRVLEGNGITNALRPHGAGQEINDAVVEAVNAVEQGLILPGAEAIAEWSEIYGSETRDTMAAALDTARSVHLTMAKRFARLVAISRCQVQTTSADDACTGNVGKAQGGINNGSTLYQKPSQNTTFKTGTLSREQLISRSGKSAVLPKDFVRKKVERENLL